MTNLSITNNTKNDIEIYIYKPEAKTMYQAVVLEPVVWTTEQNGSAGKLEFTILKYTDGDSDPSTKIAFHEGAMVIFKYKGVEVFRGRIFQKQRDKEHHIACVAYDSLRYFKNKNCPRVYNFHTGTTTTKFLNALCSSENNAFVKGEFEETEQIVTWNEVSPQTLFDMLKESSEQTIVTDPKHTIYTLYDDKGKLYYESQDNMKLDLYIDSEALEDFSYTTSIDGETYNRVLLYWGDDEGSTTTKKKTTSSERSSSDYWDEEDEENIQAWGVLQYTEKIDSSCADYKDRAKKLLEFHNQKTRELSLQGVFGDTRVRAGSSVIIDLNLGDVEPKKYVFVLKARHTFENKFHTMDLDVELKIPSKGAV